MRPVIVGISGASGSLLANETVEELLRREVPTILVCSNDARLVWQQEMDCPFNETLSRWREYPCFSDYSIGDMKAPIASGTYPTQGMVVVPCSMSSIAGLAHGLANNLPPQGRRRVHQGAAEAGGGAPGDAAACRAPGKYDDFGPDGCGGPAPGAGLLPEACNSSGT